MIAFGDSTLFCLITVSQSYRFRWILISIVFFVNIKSKQKFYPLFNSFSQQLLTIAMNMSFEWSLSTAMALLCCLWSAVGSPPIANNSRLNLKNCGYNRFSYDLDNICMKWHRSDSLRREKRYVDPQYTDYSTQPWITSIWYPE